MHCWISKSKLGLLVVTALMMAAQLRAQDVKVMSSGGFAAAYKMLGPQFEKAAGTHLDSIWGPSMGTTAGAIPVRLARGESADVVIMVRSALDALVKKGYVEPDSVVDLARSPIGMAVKAGAPVPDISTVDKLRKVLLKAHSVAYSDSASGVYIQAHLFRKLGIEDQMKSKSHMIPATPVGEIVARGQAQIGFQQISELKPIPGITIVGPIPQQVQSITVFSAGIVKKGPDQKSARDLVEFLASPDACNTIKQTGLDPVACTR
ncbi:MAG: substrate-binding domain-containing protein [Acidobacteriota bacterium]